MRRKLPHTEDQTTNLTSRRAFLRTGLALGAGALSAGLLADGSPSAVAAVSSSSSSLTKGDVAILRFLAALEILEADLWQQYNELGGIQDKEVPGGSGNKAYTEALETLDDDMPQYIHDNTDDEFSHFKFLNAYLASKGANPVNLNRFRTLPGSKASGAQQNVKRLTNLKKLTVDTSWYTRYRSSTKNPDFGDTFPQAIPDLAKGKFPAIPRDNNDLSPQKHIQAIANTAAIHFAFIEQGGTSLYPALAQRVRNPEVLRILLSIGPTETAHFQIWHDLVGDAPPLTDPTNGLTFPDLNSKTPRELFQTSLIMPEPTIFLKRKFPAVSIIRPTQTKGAAMGALKALTKDGLFIGQSQQFFSVMSNLAKAADAAQR
jgi:Ferritin-like domain